MEDDGEGREGREEGRIARRMQCYLMFYMYFPPYNSLYTCQFNSYSSIANLSEEREEKEREKEKGGRGREDWE